MNCLLELRSLTFTYPGHNQPVLKDIQFELKENERIGLIGPNGQGKTTFLHLCLGLLYPQKGQIFYKGRLVKNKKDYQILRQGISLVFQNPEDQLFCPTVLEDVAFGPLNQGFSREKARQLAEWSLNLVGLKGFEDRITHKLSGGEKRILSLATILSMQPEAMLMDEPISGLDPQTREHIISTINKLDQNLIIVSHDWDFLAQTTSILYTLDKGQLIKTDTGALHQHVHFHPSGHIPHEHKNGLKE
ncbi:MAG TPA: ABC transporter ATP-binding protein [Desulfohalobiaceae bacterium]|nr:ABC transporter ATP-binding protein [Desulfohalobiaceae bacterium]